MSWNEDRLSPSQIRAARAMLDWSMMDLARAAGLSISTVRRAELAELQPVSEDTRDLVRRTLEANGVQFLPDDGAGPGVRHKGD